MEDNEEVDNDNNQIIKCLTFSESQVLEDLNDNDDEDENVIYYHADLLPCKMWTSYLIA